jgi:entericidin B
MKALIFVVLAVSLAACNTVQGLGKDIEKGGQVIEKAAK